MSDLVKAEDLNDAEREQVWLEYAYQGNTRRASEELKAKGISISQSTLTAWKRKDPAKYEETRRIILPRIREKVEELHRQAIQRRIELADKIADRLEDKLEEIPARDLPNALRNADTGAGIHHDHVFPKRQEIAVHREESQDLPSLIRGLRELGVDVPRLLGAIEGTATEVPEPEPSPPPASKT